MIFIATDKLTDHRCTDINCGWRIKFVIEMLNNIGADQISLEMSAPNRAGIILPLDGLDEGENTLMLVMPVMLNN